MNGWGGNASIMHQGQQEIERIDILKKELSDKDGLIYRDGH